MDEGTSRGWMVPRQRNNIAPVTISFKSGEESKSSSIEAKILLFRAQVNRLLITTIRTLHSACRNYTRAEFCIFFLFFFFFQKGFYARRFLLRLFSSSHIHLEIFKWGKLMNARYQPRDTIIGTRLFFFLVGHRWSYRAK